MPKWTVLGSWNSSTQDRNKLSRGVRDTELLMEQKPKAIPNPDKAGDRVYSTGSDCRILSRSKVAVDEMLVSVVGFYTEHVSSISTGICLIIFLPLKYIYIFQVKHSAGEWAVGGRGDRARQASLSTRCRSARFVKI